MDMKPLRPKTAEKVYDILVEVCGAKEDQRNHFVANQTTDAIDEWRFCGKLGFGGKFRRYDKRLYVDCYPEDETPERRAMIDAANERLKAL